MLIRIWLALILVVIGSVLTLFLNINSYTNMAYDARKNELRHIVSLAKNTIQPLIEKQKSGLITKDESIQEGIELLNRMTFQDSYGENYIFLTNYEGTMLVIPFQKEKRDVNQWNLQDVNGKYLIQEIITLAKSKEGEGFVDYYYLPPGRDVQQKKISYIVGIPEWDAYIGTGMYTEDLERYNQKNIITIVLIAILTSIIILLSNIILVRPLYLCHRLLLSLFEDIRRNSNMIPEVNLQAFNINSEAWKLLKSFSSMLEEIHNNRYQLKKSKERFDSVLEATNDGIWDWDLGTNSIYFSSRWQALMGYGNDNCIDDFSSWQALIHSDDTDMVVTYLQACLCGSMQSYRQAFRMVHKNGDCLWVLARGHILRDKDGKAYRVIGAHTDMTEQRNAEVALEAQRNELAYLSRVAVMGELTASIAHEINQPLAAIGANAHAALRFLAFDEPDHDRIHDILIDIVSDNTRAAEVIRRLRSMLIKGKVQKSPFELNNAVNSALDIISRVAQSKKIKLKTDFCPNLAIFWGDNVQIQQIVVNLLLNAYDATGSEEGEVRVKTYTRDDSNIVISISDDGKGIDKRDIENIFEPFYSTKQKGMGMGLSICRTIAEAHGGEIIVKSNIDQGVTFEVIFPIRSESRI